MWILPFCHRENSLLGLPDRAAIGRVARDIEKALSKYIRDPVVTVIVTNFVGPYDEQIRVVGEAAKPQVLPYKEHMTLLDVMIAVGGVTDFAAGNRATILRTSQGNKQYSVRINDLMKSGDVHSAKLVLRIRKRLAKHDD